MLEYVFFDKRPWQDFVDYLKQLGLAIETAQDDDEWLVYVPEELDDETDEKIEARYETLLEMNERLIADQQGGAHVELAGINVSLMDGRVVQAAVDPQLINRLLQVISVEELGELVSAVAQAVEQGDERSLCQR
ncbi:MAG: hypothetical protein N0C88_20510 [Candidatus Thiodiazotropha lotti]|uniref:Uncharacterized protein n=1 Tax=Candidatus Thiodiazotropha lotti TaxID=2792787 RepID=A0A9E4N2S8_9GAMM|nr:hypothetical protein [Candidatus Thiodiazotropha lotti]ODC00450.1 hypothetical protein A3197_08920 [Candidatus Thiodiazotropha endoloripes]MCG7941210.1 hypothetical protein [Candidatus Thiodiazotropha lotti]MCG7986178.1 hypothetical protein [Candidatus Thiodiazotropha lotti]MCW4205688.1 hypothetical protein [Candidatus Thiodiazotropha lotti]